MRGDPFGPGGLTRRQKTFVSFRNPQRGASEGEHLRISSCARLAAPKKKLLTGRTKEPSRRILAPARTKKTHCTCLLNPPARRRIPTPNFHRASIGGAVELAGNREATKAPPPPPQLSKGARFLEGVLTSILRTTLVGGGSHGWGVSLLTTLTGSY